MAAHTVLIADVGGTNCRFQCWQLDDALHPTDMIREQASGSAGCLGLGRGALCDRGA